MNQKILFIIDGIGALVSATFLGIVLVNFNHLVGINVHTLYLLAIFPVLFAAFDFIQITKYQGRNSNALMTIGAFNISYCLLSVVLLFIHQTELTNLGYIYFIIEIVIVFTLGSIEIKQSLKKHGS